MKTATMSALRSHLGDYLNQSEPVVVTQNGHPKAVLMPVEDSEYPETVILIRIFQLGLTQLNAPMFVVRRFIAVKTRNELRYYKPAA